MELGSHSNPPSDFSLSWPTDMSMIRMGIIHILVRIRWRRALIR
jgi:hypothetical protein